MRLQALFPLACAITSFVLALLCVFAGSSPGYMEDYHIIALNTSTLGHDIVDTIKTASTTGSPIGSLINGLLGNASSILENEFIAAIGNDVVDLLASALGIKQWYSLHILNMCEGDFSPNATTPGASYNVSSCTNRTAMYRFDPSTKINEELGLGQFGLNLDQIKWPQVLTDGIQTLNLALNATFVFYITGIAAAGLEIIFSFVAVLLPSSYSPGTQLHHYHSRLVIFISTALAIISFLALGIASAIITVIMVKVTALVNQYGNDIGLYSYYGLKYMRITWAATAVMLLTIFGWISVCCFRWRSRRRVWAEKPIG